MDNEKFRTSGKSLGKHFMVEVCPFFVRNL